MDGNCGKCAGLARAARRREFAKLKMSGGSECCFMQTGVLEFEDCKFETIRTRILRRREHNY
eukprot:2455199-Prymnesium_polylepis.1